MFFITIIVALVCFSCPALLIVAPLFAFALVLASVPFVLLGVEGSAAAVFGIITLIIIVVCCCCNDRR